MSVSIIERGTPWALLMLNQTSSFAPHKAVPYEYEQGCALNINITYRNNMRRMILNNVFTEVSEQNYVII